LASGKERQKDTKNERGREKDRKREGDRKTQRTRERETGRERERVVGTHHSIAGKVDGTTVRCQRPRNACLRWRKPRWELAGEVVEWSRGCAARSAVLQLELSTA
jgi:hypothetical protein